MGREIRRVPEGWNHPKDERGHFIPLLEPADFIQHYRETEVWNAEHPDEQDDMPDPAHYADYGYKATTWWQLYENVSEGTPVTPAFATSDELVDYLVSFYRDNLTKRPMSLEHAERLVSAGSAPSMTMDSAGLRPGFEA